MKINQFTNINDNLHEQLFALYKKMFADYQGNICQAQDYFDITIVKTPPRKEQQWFSESPNDIKWVSISDMGNSGTYLYNTSEYLTADAVKKFNVTLVPDNTVLLSFKLTVGRVSITDGPMCTNEAIAHFKTENYKIIPYLYCYLKTFKYGELGSTSSIATAVNSKIIKAMPFVIPNQDDLDKFNNIAMQILSLIKNNEKSNRNLEAIRNTLLPKLMSGEIDVSSIKLDV